MPKKTDPVQTAFIAARRSQILEAATHVFARNGYHSATIRQVARRAAIADGTIYLYFKNKSDLLLGILNRLNESERREADLSQGTQEDFRSFFTGYVRQRMTLMGENLAAFQAILPELLSNSALRKRYYAEIVAPSFVLAEPLFEHLISVGTIKPIAVKQAMRVIAGSVLGILVLRMLGDPTAEQAWESFPELAADILLDGLVMEKEHARTPSQP